MPGIKKQLYGWTLVYYTIVFFLPYAFIKHDCGKTFDIELYIIYGTYLLLQAVWEVYTVIKIQNLLNNRKLLKFNSWHVVELFMGAIARTDTFIDILFVLLISNCWDIYLPWIIPTMSFAIINFLFPLFMLLKLMRTDFGNKLFQPYLESTCFAAFIRETMLLATVLDSFCINNSFYLAGRPVVFGKLMGFISFFT